MSRVKLEMTGADVVMALAEGNPGALNVCVSIMQKGAALDPDDFFGGLGALLSLDTHGIYGPRIWMLYKDVCGQNLAKALGMLRAVQLGFVSEAQLSHAIDNRGDGLDVAGLLAKVKERLPKFAAAGVAP